MTTAPRRAPEGMRTLKYRELKAYGVPYSRSYIDTLEREGKFPKRVAPSPCRVGWVEGEIISYVRVMHAERSTEPGKLGSAGKTKRRGGHPPKKTAGNVDRLKA